MLLMVTGMPIAFCFLLVDLVAAVVLMGGQTGIEQFIISMYSSLTSFILLPVPLFILMGELVLHSGVVSQVLTVLDKWLGGLPGRLALLSIFGGTIFATLTGTSIANIALLGSTLGPEMKNRGYSNSMALGPILGAGGLAIMIPPSSLGVLLGALGNISIGRLLIAIIIPGLLMAVIFSAYIILRCYLQPSIAPSYKVPPVPLSEKLMDTVRYVLPLAIVIFLVVGVILLGIATPSEAAATGTMGSFIIVLLYRRLSWNVVTLSLSGTIKITGMIFLLISGATAFSQIMSFSGATTVLAKISSTMPVAPIAVVIIMMAVVFVLACFIDPVSIMMITLPVYVPIILALGFDPVWFGVLYLLNIETGMITPPFGMGLFVMKGVASPDTTVGDIYKAAAPFVALNVATMAVILVFPNIALWLTRYVG